ncbi:MAG: hypothetical protein GXP46_07515, partial [Deferribacteres bacterium]|nr:hypothetical protein [Deferribacteres bacterium]
MKSMRNYSVLLFIFLLAVALPVSVSADTNVSGIISGDTTWTQAGSPYIVTGNVLVSSGVTLTVEPGVTVKFDSGTGLQVDGTLIARGTDTDNIIFTSRQATPAPGDWAYIFFTDTSADATYDSDGNYTGGSILEYSVIEYAGGSTGGAVQMNNAHPFISHCRITNSSAAGINTYNLSGTLRITDTTVGNNAAVGIFIRGGRAVISNNVISGNTGFAAGGIYATGDTVISDNIISNNSGDGISVMGGTATVSNNVISGNSASHGGGIYIETGITTITGNTIIDNTASFEGGGIWLNGTAVISRNIITNNTASDEGGGIYVKNSTATITNNSIAGNHAGNASAVYYYNANQDFKNNTITGNTATG